MNDKSSAPASLTLEYPVKATSAFTSVYYKALFIGGWILLLIMTLLLYFSNNSYVFALLITILMPLNIWAVLSKSIEVNNDGIKLEEAWKKRFFKWNEIEAIKIEQVFFWKVLSLWVKGKKVGLNLSGLKADELSLFNQTVVAQAGLRKLTIK